MFFIKRENLAFSLFPFPHFLSEFRGELAGKDIWTHIKFNQDGCMHPATKLTEP